MKNLFIFEIVRYRKWLIALFAFVLLFMFFGWGEVEAFPQIHKSKFVSFLIVSFATVFGFVHMRQYREEGRWAYLVHRPLNANKICLSLVGAGVTVIASGMFFPILLMTVYWDIFTHIDIDMSDYIHVFSSLTRGVAFYLASCLVVINTQKGVRFIYISLAVILLFIPASTLLSLLLPSAVIVLVLLYMYVRDFEPNTSDSSTKPVNVVLHTTFAVMGISTVLAIAVSLLLSVGSLIFFGKKDPAPSQGTLAYFTIIPEQNDWLAYALESSDHPQKDSYISQAMLAEKGTVHSRNLGFRFPFRGQVLSASRSSGISYFNEEKNSKWVFSHSSMLIEGRDSVTNTSKGFVGKNGFVAPGNVIQESDRFSKVPLLAMGQYIITPDTIFRVDFEDRLFETKHQLTKGERYVSLPQDREKFVSIRTNRRLLVFDKRDFLSENEEVGPEYATSFPVDYYRINGITFFELVDGYLFVFRSPHLYGYERPGVEVFHARLGGQSEFIGRREFTEFDTPFWLNYISYFLSPATSYFSWFFEGWMTAGEEKMQFYFPPSSLYLPMAIIQTISFILVTLMCRFHRLSRGLTLTWVGLALVFSFPVFINFILLNRGVSLKKVLVKKRGLSRQGGQTHDALSI